MCEFQNLEPGRLVLVAGALVLCHLRPDALRFSLEFSGLPAFVRDLPAQAVVVGVKDADSRAPRAAKIARGRAVYEEQRCRVRHSIDGEGNTRSPLDGVGGRLTEREIRLWIVAPQDMNPAVANRGYQLSEENLNALVAYLIANTHQ